MRSKWMRKVVAVVVAVFGLLLGTAGAASADVADWSANGESEIVSPTEVRLQGVNTSVETGNLNVNVNEGTTISFDYELRDGAKCEAGAPRVFTFVNGTINKSSACDGGGLAAESGTITYETDRAGLIDHTGLVYDSGRPGHVIISNLTVGGELVLFMEEPEPEPTVVTPEAPTVAQAVCVEGELEPATLTVPDVEGVTYSRESGVLDASVHRVLFVTATPDEGYVFEGGDDAVSFTVTVNKAPICPTGTPTGEPTGTPTETPEPTETPTATPTGDPTSEPTGTPTVEPTTEPTDEPTSEPTGQPTGEPSTPSVNDCEAYVDALDNGCDPDRADYDCADIDGPVELVDPGNDPFGLDGDGDGVGCEGPGSSPEPTDDPTPDDDTTPVSGDGEELADTGVNPWLIGVGALAVLAGGAAVITQRVSGRG